MNCAHGKRVPFLAQVLSFRTIGIAIGIAYLIARIFKIRDSVSYLFIGIGAISPVLIDKPLSVILYGNISNGRIFMHTLLVFFILFLIGLVIFKSGGDAKMLCLSGGVFWHLIEDKMWEEPVTLFWPLYGNFPVKEHEEVFNWVISMLMQIKEPFTFITEVVGFVIVLLLLKSCVSSRRFIIRKQVKEEGRGNLQN